MEAKDLPVKYTDLTRFQKRKVRELYIRVQFEKCWYCGESLYEEPPEHITEKRIDWDLFPPNFLRYPIHLDHDHGSGMTRGAVHAFCNAYMWQYHGQ